MDGRNFDELTKVVSESASRRTVAKAIAGGALASALGVFGLRSAAAQDDPITSDAKTCRATNKNCDNDDQCCSNRCKRSNGKKACQCRGHGANCLDVNGKRRNKACCSGRCKKNGKCSS